MITQTPYKNLIVTLDHSEIENVRFLINKYHIPFVIELGTYRGGSALVMADAGASVQTYDKTDLVENKDSRITYRVADVFNPEVTDEIKQLCSAQGLKMLFCDNGLKKLELNTYGPHLTQGDILCAHDYPIEFKDADISQMIADNGYSRIELPHNDRIIAWERVK
jgi:cephalosporin hydroxylase